MMINIRGSFGAGKSTVVRRVMDLHETVAAHHVDGRRQPLYYVCLRPSGVGERNNLAVVGHYETECGGCDTIPKLDKLFGLVAWLDAEGYDVLFEGATLLYYEVRRTLALAKRGELRVIEMDVNLATCLRGIEDRRSRSKRKTSKPINVANVEAKRKTTRTAVAKLRAAGVETRRLGREETYNQVREWLGL